MPLSSLASLNVGKEEWGWAEGKKGLTPAINCSPREEPIHVRGQNRHRVVARRHLGRSGDYPTLLQSKTSVQAPRNRGQDAGCMGGEAGISSLPGGRRGRSCPCRAAQLKVCPCCSVASAVKSPRTREACMSVSASPGPSVTPPVWWQ